MSSEEITTYKIVFIGNPNVGKTEIISRIVDKPFIGESEATIGVDYEKKNINFQGKNIKLQLWDTAGYEKFRGLIPCYLQGSTIAFIVYDVNDRTSFENSANWINFVKSNNQDNNTKIVLCGNKIDLRERKVKTLEGEALAKKEGLSFFEVSAKTKEGIDDMLYKSIANLFTLDEKTSNKINSVNVSKINNNKDEKEKIKKIEKQKLLNEGKDIKLDINNIQKNINIDNKKNVDIKIELEKYIKENNKLKEEIKILKNENIKLKDKLDKIKDIKNIPNNLKDLKKELINKEKEINILKDRLSALDKNNRNVNFNDIMVINFISGDGTINEGIKCLKTDIFAEVEEKLYQKYDEYREKNNIFLAGGQVVLRFKKIYENNIKDGDKVQLQDFET